MTSHTVTYKCEHVREIELPAEERAAQIAVWNAEQGKCPGCNMHQGAERRAYFLGAYGDLPALAGSTKQIEFATKIRAAALVEIEFDLPTWVRSADRRPAIRAWLASQAEAKWWIEFRDMKTWDLISIARKATRPQ